MKNNKEILIAPSVLSANFAYMAEGIKLIEDSKADLVHLDVMDGSFVPNITFGPKMVQDIKSITNLPLDTHLMINNPGKYIEDFAKAGSDYITIHQEAEVHLHRSLEKIKSLNKKCGLSIVPSTPVSVLKELLPMLDMVLIMTVNPGFGGQSMIDSCLNKVAELDKIRKEESLNFLISVDGGVNLNTYKKVLNVGTDILVCGSAFFSSKDPKADVATFKQIK